MQEPDWPLIQAAVQDTEAFRPLYERYYTDVYRVIYRRTVDRDLAADLTQQTFLQALNKLHRYRPTGRFGSWLVTLALNEVRQYYRSSKREQQWQAATPQLQQLLHDSGEAGVHQDLLPGLEKALSKMKTDEQELIQLRYFDEMPFADIAHILNKKEAAVKMQLYRLLDKLKTTLSHA